MGLFFCVTKGFPSSIDICIYILVVTKYFLEHILGIELGWGESMNMHKPLSEMPIGTIGTVVEIGLTGLSKRRLMDLGFTLGAKIQVLRRSPAGDPTAYNLRGTTIALRKNEAKNISIIPDTKFRLE